jgi:hypothetical protein
MKRRSERAKFGSFAWVFSVTSIESLAYAIVWLCGHTTRKPPLTSCVC